VAAAYTIEALLRAGIQVTFAGPGEAAERDRAPVVPGLDIRCVAVHPRSLLASVVSSFVRRRPLSVVRHDHLAMRQEVASLVRDSAFDCVHIEQVQALASAGPAFSAGFPVVLRCQNVESDLWRASARWAGMLSPLAHFEASRMAAYEARAARSVSGVVALTKGDAEAISRLSGKAVLAVPAPFPPLLDPGTSHLDGTPPVVLLGDSRWRPNAEAARWFVSSVWSRVVDRLPGARLHAFGQEPCDSHPSIRWMPSPGDSAEALPAGAILAVPLFVGSGIRIKILEAWARRVPVVASPVAAAGLDVTDGQELLIATDPTDFAAAIARYHASPALVDRTTASGAARLVAVHDPASVARQLQAVYERALGRKMKSMQ
jgi:polysaccharide biosynthesis protein PslH